MLGAIVLHVRSIFQPGTMSSIDDSSESRARLVCARCALSSILPSNFVKSGVSGNVRNWLGSGSKIYKPPARSQRGCTTIKGGFDALKMLKNKAHQDSVYPRRRLILEEIG